MTMERRYAKLKVHRRVKSLNVGLFVFNVAEKHSLPSHVCKHRGLKPEPLSTWLMVSEGIGKTFSRCCLRYTFGWSLFFHGRTINQQNSEVIVNGDLYFTELWLHLKLQQFCCLTHFNVSDVFTDTLLNCLMKSLNLIPASTFLFLCISLFQPKTLVKLSFLLHSKLRTQQLLFRQSLVGRILKCCGAMVSIWFLFTQFADQINDQIPALLEENKFFSTLIRIFWLSANKRRSSAVGGPSQC